MGSGGKSTVYNILKKYSIRNTVARKMGSGGKNKKVSNARRAAIVRNNINKIGGSMRKLSNKHCILDNS